MWYVPLSLHDPDEVQKVPKMTYTTPEVEENGKAEYQKQKADRQRNELNMAPIPHIFTPYTPGEYNNKVQRESIGI